MTDYEQELKTINQELREIEAKLRSLSERKEILKKRKEFLTDAQLLEKSRKAGEDDQWERKDFPWYSKLLELLQNVFKLSKFRQNQLAAINATLSKKDVIVIMPTGGGKSLCYQLPALVDKGFTLVISPMLSLMEDQVMQLRSLDIKAEMFSASLPFKDVSRIYEMMSDVKSGLKLVYVTPEKLSKTKRLMSRLQKCYASGSLARIAVDEVHCCSQWGHDFRTDYQFLSVLKGMFFDVPMIGLTATATTKVILDVQKMLLIQGCLIFKSSFNRPNLFYEVQEKPAVHKECVNQLVDLLTRRFRNMSGIIYTATISDCEQIRQDLRAHGLRVNGYHAQLEAEVRSKIHRKWLSGEYQAVVATIAFGLGIDKPDVRFVIHHSLSKSMENFYQESGRAGRDGKPSTCVMLFRFADIFRISTMVFTQKTGLLNLSSVISYCLNYAECRRKIIASHFDETWENTDCNDMCDNCKEPYELAEIDITDACLAFYKILDHAAGEDVKLTTQMLLDAWFGKTNKIKVKLTKVPAYSVNFAGNIAAYLLICDYLKEEFTFTPYSTISYIKKGPKAELVTGDHRIKMTVKGKTRKRKRVTSPLLVNINDDETDDEKLEENKRVSTSNISKIKNTKCGNEDDKSKVIKNVSGENKGIKMKDKYVDLKANCFAIKDSKKPRHHADQNLNEEYKDFKEGGEHSGSVSGR